jgi:hypothetical protein
MGSTDGLNPTFNKSLSRAVVAIGGDTEIIDHAYDDGYRRQ